MDRRRLTFAASLLAAVVLLPGCDQLKALLAFVGMGAGAVLQSRPDRTLTYEIEVVTNDGKGLSFSGSTACEHRVNMHASSRYSTRNPSALVEVRGEEWILSGIDCHNEIVDKRPQQYALYRTINETQGKVYYVMEGGAARIKKAAFDSSVGAPSKRASSETQRYIDGPYLYQKVFLSTEPPAVGSHSKPVVVFGGTSTCGRRNNGGIKLSEEAFFEQFRRGVSVAAIEEGVLVFDSSHSAWTPRAGVNLSAPLDVAAAPSPDEVPYGCVKLLFDGQAFVVSQSALGSLLYVPAEKAFYRVAKTWFSGALQYVNDQMAWKSCPMPQDVQMKTGVFYLDRAKGFGAIKHNADGSFSCRSNFRWLGSS